ncbi:MAG: septum formation initiator family protein [Chthoniobacterales bacterium]|nr:septum formation initiator family protein [Chthoniobacterales bacterium]
MNRHRPHQSASKREKQTTLLPLINRLLLTLIFFGVLALVLMAFYPEWRKLSQMHRALQNDRNELTKLQKETTHRERELYLLQHDKEYLELIARDRLDLMKPNETIFRFSPPRGESQLNRSHP